VDRRRVRVVEAAGAEPGVLAAALRAFRDDVAALAAPGDDDAADLIRLCRARGEDPDLEEAS